jgi:DNA-binding response OmpR family regulator
VASTLDLTSAESARAMAEHPSILIVDDDPGLRETLDDFLSAEGYAIRQSSNVTEARAAIAAAGPDLILLDINMPGGDGLTLAAELRAKTLLPIIILSGKGSMVDKVVGLEVGADDYVAKPFELRELLARVRAVLRRAKLVTAVPLEGLRQAHFDAFVLTPSRRDLSTASGEHIDLTGAEYNLAALFVDRPNRVLTREAVGEATHKDDWEAFDRSVDTLVSRLRRKLTRHATQPNLIQTVRGEGYVLACAVRWSGTTDS